MSKDLAPQNAESSRPIKQKEELVAEIEDVKQETKRLRAQSAIPVIKAVKDEIVRRAQNGELREELKNKKIGSLIKDLATIKQVLEDNMPSVVVMAPPAPASDGKDITWTRANSVIGKSESERKKMRDAIEGEKA